MATSKRAPPSRTGWGPPAKISLDVRRGPRAPMTLAKALLLSQIKHQKSQACKLSEHYLTKSYPKLKAEGKLADSAEEFLYDVLRPYYDELKRAEGELRAADDVPAGLYLPKMPNILQILLTGERLCDCYARVSAELLAHAEAAHALVNDETSVWYLKEANRKYGAAQKAVADADAAAAAGAALLSAAGGAPDEPAVPKPLFTLLPTPESKPAVLSGRELQLVTAQKAAAEREERILRQAVYEAKDAVHKAKIQKIESMDGIGKRAAALAASHFEDAEEKEIAAKAAAEYAEKQAKLPKRFLY